MTCGPCFDLVTETPPRYLTLSQRLWGRCYSVGGCWEYGQKKSDGRPVSIMADRRQVPPAHVALFLSGSVRPTPLHSTRHKCNNPMCVNPDHLEWFEEATPRGPMWAHMMAPDSLARYHELRRAKKAKYQRNYRSKAREKDRERFDAALANSPKPAPAPPVEAKAPAAPPVVERPVVPTPAPKVDLLAALSGAKIAPPE